MRQVRPRGAKIHAAVLSRAGAAVIVLSHTAHRPTMHTGLIRVQLASEPAAPPTTFCLLYTSPSPRD
eukprot:2910976-Alexandrium_andersonii.AAC.1